MIRDCPINTLETTRSCKFKVESPSGRLYFASVRRLTSEVPSLSILTTGQEPEIPEPMGLSEPLLFVPEQSTCSLGLRRGRRWGLWGSSQVFTST